ncbi:putative transcription factor bHLH107 [Bidens hawaiensis]|uniref:putative transcription factor bHLH107 n=1 Tax=Bidens hawaiensis TaxID=980011 RepID=UPI00404B66D2
MVGSFQGDQRDQESDEILKKIFNGGDSSSSIDEGLVEVTKLEEIADLVSRKHALSERKRRKRINNHYDSLRRLFPRLLKVSSKTCISPCIRDTNTCHIDNQDNIYPQINVCFTYTLLQTDKASVLSETVRCLKELKNMVAGIALSQEFGDRWTHKKARQLFCIPSETDEVLVSYCDNGDKTIAQAIICCEDRPDLNRGLMEAVKSVRGKAVKAEMATVCGRTKVDMLVEWPKCGDRGGDVGLLRRALTAMVENKIIGRTEFMSCESTKTCWTEFMGHDSTEPEFIGLSRKFVDGVRPNLYDETEIGYADGLIVRSL